MWFWFFILANCLSVPVILLLIGWMFQKHAPQSVNGIFGYRTRRAMKNDDTWKFAQQAFGQLSFHWGLAELPVTLLSMLVVYGQSDSVIGITGGVLCLFLCFPIFLMIWQVERALKKQFDEKGRRL